MNDISRRCRLDLNTPAELAIHNAIQEVEKVGADVRLTNSVIKLIEAKESLADFIDDIDSSQNCVSSDQAKGFHLSFGGAIEALKAGQKVSREGWNGKGMFIFMRPADELHVAFVVEKVKSLPQSVKDYYRQDMVDEKGNPFPLKEDDVVKFTAYLCLKAADGTIVNGWLASQTDILADDWQIVP